LLKQRVEYYGKGIISGYSTPASDDVQNVFLPILIRLLVQLVSFAADQPPESSPKPLSLNMSKRDDIESIPGVFSTLNRAEKFQNSILKLLLCFTSKGQQLISRQDAQLELAQSTSFLNQYHRLFSMRKKLYEKTSASS